MMPLAAACIALCAGLAQAQPASGPEVVSEIRVHGNATLSDAFVVKLSGVEIGAPLDTGGTAAIEKRLRDTGLFDVVSVRKRYRTLDMAQVALLLVVHEKPGVSPAGAPPSVLRQIRNRLLFFPIIDYDDGYGWTYGARTSVVGLLGRRDRVSVPLSWGATKRATVEVEHPFSSGPLTRVLGSFGIVQFENPHFVARDRRTDVKVRAERRLFDRLIIGAAAGHTRIAFTPVAEPARADRDRFWTTGADVTLDTRIDPAFPVDAVVTGVSWTRMSAEGSPFAAHGVPSASAIDTYTLLAKGYKRIFRQVVFAARTEYDTASAPLPDYDVWLLGGTTLRGTPPELFAGDKRLMWGGELRVPISSPLHDIGRTGVNVFLDGGEVAPYGESIAHAHTERGVGAGFFIIATVIHLNFEVVRSLNGRGTRFHFDTGFAF